MAIQSLHPYPWESVYKAVVLEADGATLDERILDERIEVAEEALLTRWLELTQRRENNIEIHAIVDATEALRNLKREWLRKRRLGDQAA